MLYNSPILFKKDLHSTIFRLLQKFGYYVGQDDCGYKAYIKDLKYNDYIAIYDDRTILIDLEDFCETELFSINTSPYYFS